MSEIFDALSSSNGDDPVFKFANPGDTIAGVIIETPKVLPLKAYGSDEPKLDRDGNPEKQVLLTVASEHAASKTHDGRWRVYLDKPLLKDAVREAMKAAGVDGIGLGDEISITFTGMATLKSGRQAKAFDVKFAAAPDPWADAPTNPAPTPA